MIKEINAYFGMPTRTENGLLYEAKRSSLVLSGKPMTTFHTDDDAWKFTEGEIWKCIVHARRPEPDRRGS